MKKAKGLGKVVLYAATLDCFEVSDSGDEAGINVAPIEFPSDACFQATMLDFSHCEKSEGVRMAHAPPKDIKVVLSLVLVQIVYPEEYMQDNQFGPLTNFVDHAYGDLSLFESGVENATIIIHDDDKTLGEFHTQPKNSFHSVDLESSIVTHNGAISVNQEPLMEPTSLSSASRRRKRNEEEDSASSALKRSKV